MEICRLGQVDLKNNINKYIMISGILAKISTRMAKNNSLFATLTLKDKSRDIEIKWFDFDESYRECLVVGKLYALYCVIQAYDKGVDGISLLVVDNKFMELTDNIDDYLDKEENVAQAFDKINKYVDMLEGYPLGRLVTEILNENYDKFCKYSAAVSFHHTGIGGLMVHTASVCELSVLIGEYYNKYYNKDIVNIKLLICGALMHDIGKLEELEIEEGTNICSYSTMSILENHIVSGVKTIVKKAASLGLDGRELDELIHLIISHHGKPEFGSPVSPNMLEAKILSMADDMDATVYRFKKVLDNIDYGDGLTEWKAGQKLSYYKSSLIGREPSEI